jgi:hypothetical protein
MSRNKWKRVAEFPEVRVFGVGERNRNGSDRQLIISGCKPGMKVTLRHDPDQSSGQLAIAVIVAGGQQIGILDPEVGAQVAPFLASDDVRFSAKIANVGPMEDEKGRMLAGAEIALIREDFTAAERFAPLGFVGPLASLVDRRLVSATKGDRVMLGIARAVAIFLAAFFVLAIVLTIVSLVRGLFQ